MNVEFYDSLDEGTRSLIDWQYHRHGGFYEALWKAISYADEPHQEKIGKGFPEHIAAYRKYTRESGWWQKIQEGLEV